MRGFGRFHAKFLIVNRPRHNRCEIRAFALKIMCENAHRAALTLSLLSEVSDI